MFPFSLKAGKYAVYKQMQYLHFKLTRKFRKKPLIIDINAGSNNCKIEIVPGMDFHQMHLFMAGCYEKEVATFILNETGPDAVFVDVGAYIGFYSLMVSCMYPDIRVCAFEPQKTAIEKFKKNIILNNIKNIEVYDCAIADLNETLPLYINKFPEQTSLHKPVIQQGHSYNVQVKRLDDLLTVKGKEIIVKIDTEGYEFEVLKSMTEIIKNNVCTIYFEYNPKIYLKQYSENYIASLIDFINDKGCRICEIGAKGILKDFTYYPQQSEQKNLVIINAI